jgi:hypothetical protein
MTDARGFQRRSKPVEKELFNQTKPMCEPVEGIVTVSCTGNFSHRGQDMSRFIVALFLLLAAQPANAAECGSTANRAGCTTRNGAVGVGPNGAATYNKKTGDVHSAQPNNNYNSNQAAPGTSVQGRHGNSATKALEPGCAFVNGKRVCN